MGHPVQIVVAPPVGQHDRAIGYASAYREHCLGGAARSFETHPFSRTQSESPRIAGRDDGGIPPYGSFRDVVKERVDGMGDPTAGYGEHTPFPGRCRACRSQSGAYPSGPGAIELDTAGGRRKARLQISAASLGADDATRPARPRLAPARQCIAECLGLPIDMRPAEGRSDAIRDPQLLALAAAER